MDRILINGVELAYELTGEGEPLVLVHGSWTDANGWRLLAPELAATHRVLVYDRRGHSRSERPADHGARRLHEDDLVGLLEALDLAPVHVVGSSYGGCIALAVARRRPDLVGSVSVHEPPLTSVLDDDDAREIRARFDDVAEELRHGDPERGTRQFIEEVALGPGAWEVLPQAARDVYVANGPTFTAMTDAEGWDHLDLDRWGDVPVLVTDGTTSTPWLRRIAASLVAGIPGSRHRTIDGAGHVPHLTHAPEYAEVIRGFIAELRPSATVGAPESRRSSPA